jgi:2-polyprenyl-6-methoxyphenol hydroxylase-like FAD-dependent oxidoreductase
MATVAGFISEPQRNTPVKAETEVLVIGGGTAGVSAAVAAARNGAEVILVERLGYLGGLATGGLIALLLTLDDGRGRQVIGGLCQEITDRLQKRGAAHFPSRNEWGSTDEKLIARNQQWGLVWGHGPHRVRYSVAYDAEEFKFALNTMAEEAKARLLFHCYACDAIVDGDRITGVTFQSKAGRFAILAKTVIDASGDGDIFTSAGATYEKEAVLPWLWFTMGGVENAEAAIEKGGWFFRTLGDGRVLLPWGATERVARKIDATDPDDLSYAELACRRRVAISRTSSGLRKAAV